MTDLLNSQRITSAEVSRIFRDPRDWFTAEERADAHLLVDDDPDIHAGEPSETSKYIITGEIGTGKSALATVLARRLGRRNHDLVHGGGILRGVGVPPLMIIQALPDLPNNIVVVLPLDTLHAMRAMTGSDEKSWWWHHLEPFDAVIITSAAYPRDLDLLGDLGIPSLAELEANPTVALCMPTRCEMEAIEWIQNGENSRPLAKRLGWHSS